MAGGRPSIYSETLADEICRRLATGDTLIGMCEEPGMPTERVVHKWLGIHDEFVQKYARARAEQCDHIAEDIMRISDSEEDPNRARVRIDARKWFASKVAPKKYGDRTGVDVDGELKITIELKKPEDAP